MTKTNNSLQIFSSKAIMFGSFLGGPIAGGYFLFHNFKTVGEKTVARNILVGSFIFSIALILFLFFLDGLSIDLPRFVAPLLYTMVFMQISNSFLQKHRKKIEEQSITTKAWYKTVVVSVLGLFTIVSMFVGIYLLIPLQYYCEVSEDSRNGKVYDQFEADCMIYEGLEKSLSIDEIDVVLTLESEYLQKEGLYSETAQGRDRTQIVDPLQYILDNYSGTLTSEEIIKILDSEIEYLKFIGVVEEAGGI